MSIDLFSRSWYNKNSRYTYVHRQAEEVSSILLVLKRHFAGYLHPFNLFYAPLHAAVGIIVVYVTTKSLASVSLYVLLDMVLHGIFVHELARKAGSRVREGSDLIGSAFFFVFHVFAAFALATAVTLGDVNAAVKIGLAEPVAQGVVQFVYRKVWRKLER